MKWIYALLALLFVLHLVQSSAIKQMQQEIHQMQVVLTEGW